VLGKKTRRLQALAPAPLRLRWGARSRSENPRRRRRLPSLPTCLTARSATTRECAKSPCECRLLGCVPSPKLKQTETVELKRHKPCIAQRPTSRFGPAYGSRGQSLVVVASHGHHSAERSEPMMCVLTTISICVARILHAAWQCCKPHTPARSRACSQVSQHDRRHSPGTLASPSSAMGRTKSTRKPLAKKADICQA
jgi:hypothetical protein